MVVYWRIFWLAATVLAASSPAALAASDADAMAIAFKTSFAGLALPQDDAQPPEDAPDGDQLLPSAKNPIRRGDQPAGGYRTVCVRLCDGYYWPLSASTSMDRFQHDRTVCESSCQQPAKLYYQPAGETNARQFVSLDGKPYMALQKAFSYRTRLSPECRCRPDPWSESEVERHRLYSAESQTSPPVQVADRPVRVPAPAAEEVNDDADAASADTLSRAFGALLDPPPKLRGRQKPVDGARQLDVPLR